VIKKLALTLGLAILLLAANPVAKADGVYGYAFGISLQNTVVPGSDVTIEAVLLNTGSLPIVFAPSFPGGLPSVQGGSLPFASVGSNGQWSVLSNGGFFGDFSQQFAGVTVAPGQSFQFTFGGFEAPTNQALGTSAMPQPNFGIEFTDTIEGNLLALCHPGGCNFDNTPNATYTLGNSSSSSPITFFQGLVVDTGTGRIVTAPEPPSGILLLLGVLFSGLVYMLATKRA
jgi:hypothetical protein